MSLAFLSKKSWHVTNFTNQESVWKAEQVKAEENRKLDEWKMKREEERQIEELRRLQHESGQGVTAKRQERVDFLYEQQTTKKEEYLLGKPVEPEVEESEVKKVESLPGANFLGVGQNNLSSAANEEFNKMNNDPLLAMRAEEQKALQRLMANPLKMKAIRSQVEERKSEITSERDGGSGGKHHKHHKSDKHGKHHKSDKHSKSHKSDKHKSSKHSSSHRGDHKSSRRHSSDDDSEEEDNRRRGGGGAASSRSGTGTAEWYAAVWLGRPSKV